MTVPRDADPHNKAGIHGQLDLHPTYGTGWRLNRGRGLATARAVAGALDAGGWEAAAGFGVSPRSL
jgi:hypothetical protein